MPIVNHTPSTRRSVVSRNGPTIITTNSLSRNNDDSAQNTNPQSSAAGDRPTGQQRPNDTNQNKIRQSQRPDRRRRRRRRDSAWSPRIFATNFGGKEKRRMV